MKNCIIGETICFAIGLLSLTFIDYRNIIYIKTYVETNCVFKGELWANLDVLI